MKMKYYRSLEHSDQVNELISLLESNDIPYEITTQSQLIDDFIVGSKLRPKFTLKLFPADFKKVNTLHEEFIEEQGIDIDVFPHLKDLSKIELLEIVKTPYQWSRESVIAARQLLKNQGIEITNEQIEKWKKVSLEKEKVTKKASTIVQILYMIAAGIGLYNFVFSLIGIAMGYYYVFGNNNDSEGNQYFIYQKTSRDIGKIILGVGILSIIIQLFLLINLFKS